MIKSTGILAAAALTGFALATSMMVVAPFNSSANAAAGQTYPAGRIGGAFAAATEFEAAPALMKAALRAAKGDLFASRDCGTATWPNIDRACLVTADGTPAPAVRTVTIGYQEGANTTILVRMPAPAIAAR